jgi:hypothetical protein
MSCVRPDDTIVLPWVCGSSLAAFMDLYVVFECMDIDLEKLGRDQRQSLSLDHVQHFMYEVRGGLVACTIAWPYLVHVGVRVLIETAPPCSC